MNNKEARKVQFGKWTKKDFKEIRQKIKKRIAKDFNIEEKLL